MAPEPKRLNGIGPTRLVDPDATEQTRALRRRLAAVAESENILFGHQNALVQSVADHPEGDVHAATGRHPAVAGLGNGHVGTDLTAEAIRLAHDRGMITTVEDHMPNFATGGPYDDCSPVAEHILPGGKDHAAFLARLAGIADWALAARDEHGDPIPVVFRPFHEHSGDWFWWGTGNTTEVEYIALWRFTVEYLRDTQGVHNFLYAYSPNGHFTIEADYLDRWPGDDYVDLVGFDSYHDLPAGPDDPWWAAVLHDARTVTRVARAKHKIAAATEIGLRHNAQDGLAPTGNAIPDWYTRLADLFTGDPDLALAYVATWRNHPFHLSDAEGAAHHFWVPYPAFTDTNGTHHPDHEMLPDFRAFARHERVLFAPQPY